MGSRLDPEPTARYLADRLDHRTPAVGIVLGSGLGGLITRLSDTMTFPYSDVPGFETSTVAGHRGELVAGRLAGVEVIVQSGRFHLYEGHTADTVTFPVRVFAELGIRSLMVTNAGGGIRRSFLPGTLMLIADHINLTFRNPLFGAVLQGEERFPDMSDPYDPGLRQLAHTVAKDLGIPLADGVYAGLLGPSYETPAEVRMLERLGADVVGMSTVLEVVAARARGLRCLGVSVVTNAAAGISPHKLDHSEVLEMGQEAGGQLTELLQGIVAGDRAGEP